MYSSITVVGKCNQCRNTQTASTVMLEPQERSVKVEKDIVLCILFIQQESFRAKIDKRETTLWHVLTVLLYTCTCMSWGKFRTDGIWWKLHFQTWIWSYDIKVFRYTEMVKTDLNIFIIPYCICKHGWIWSYDIEV